MKNLKMHQVDKHEMIILKANDIPEIYSPSWGQN